MLEGLLVREEERNNYIVLFYFAVVWSPDGTLKLTDFVSCCYFRSIIRLKR